MTGTPVTVASNGAEALTMPLGDDWKRSQLPADVDRDVHLQHDLARGQ
jgi:hypothetical protein